MSNKLRKLKNIFIVIVLLVLHVILLNNIINQDNHHTQIDYNIDSAVPFADIWKDTNITQTFVSSVNKLESIQFQIGTYGKKIENREVHLTLFDNNDNIVCESFIDSAKIEDSQFIVFSFEKISESKGNEYTLKLECQECTKDEKLAIFGQASSNNEESAIIDNEKVAYKAAYILTGDTYYKNVIIWTSILIFILSFYLYFENISKVKYKFNNFLKIFDKNIIFFILELITSLIMVISLFTTIYTCNYKFNFPIFSFLIFYLSCQLLLGEFAFKLKSNIKVEQFFLLLAIPIGLCYLTFMVPTEVADEIVHYASAYNYSQGNLRYTKNYTEIPEIIINNNRGNNYQELISLLRTPKNSAFQVMTISGYNVVGYLPAVLGISVCNLLNLPYFIGFCLARLLTFICVLVLGYFSIKLLPIGKMLLCVYFLNPMFIHQAISISLDAMLNSYCIFLISYILYLSHKKDAITKWNKMLLIILMLFISVLKYVYIPLFLLALVLLFKKNMKKSDKILISGLILFSGIISVLIYYLHSLVPLEIISDYALTNDISVTGQIKYLISNPLAVISVLKNTFTNMGLYYFESAFGVYLGWLDLIINRIYIYMYIILLFISPFLIKENENYTRLEKILLLVCFIIIVLLIIFGLYLTWSNVGATVAAGVQGRYFIPIMILFLLLLCHKERYLKFKNPWILTGVVLFIIHFNVIVSIINQFL